MNKLFLLGILLLSSCATTQRQPLVQKMFLQVDGPARAQLETSTPDGLQKIVESGLQKIPLDDLYALNHYRVKMIESSRENCMTILEDRTVASPRKEKALAALTDSDYDQYSKIIAKAISLGAYHDPKIPVIPNKKEFTKAFDIALDAPIAGNMPAYLNEVKDVEQDQCWVIHKGLRYADEKRNRIAEIIVRYMGM